MAKLLIQTSSGEWITHELAGSLTTVGRNSENRIVLDDVSVSSHHAEILRTKDGYRLHDCQSFNGTVLNGEPVTDAPLHDEDVVCFASVAAIFSCRAETPAKQDIRAPSLTARRTSNSIVMVSLGVALGAAATILYIQLSPGFLRAVGDKAETSRTRVHTPPAPQISRVVANDNPDLVASTVIARGGPAERLRKDLRPKTAEEERREQTRRALLQKDAKFAELSEEIRNEEDWIRHQIDDAWRAGRIFERGYSREMAAERFKANRLFLDIKKHQRDSMLENALKANSPDTWQTGNARRQSSRLGEGQPQQ
jgi:pSer/pThr/pTyr-binding forkhead associated (FHA) protein